MFKGKLLVTMKFVMPVSEDMYPVLQKKNAILRLEMHEAQIIAVEEENYNSDPDLFLEAIMDHITEVSFDVERSQERWDES